MSLGFLTVGQKKSEEADKDFGKLHFSQFLHKTINQENDLVNIPTNFWKCSN